MRPLLIILSGFVSLSLFGKSVMREAAIVHNLYSDTLIAKKPLPDTTTRFAYAEMVLQRANNNKMFVEGEYVSEQLKKLIAASKYKSWALAYMGEDGWELVSVVYDQFSFYFYFKKRIQ